MDGNGCVSGTTSTITVNPLPVLTISPDMTVCPLEVTTLTAGGAATYTWSPNIFLNNNYTSTVISNPSVTTTYTIDGLSAAACSNSTVMTIAVVNSLVINANAVTPTICPSGSTSLTASGATSYTWSPSLTLNSANGSDVIASPQTSTTYTVIGATSTCTNSAEVVVTLTLNPSITIVSSPSVICSGSSSTLTANGASSYTWSPVTTLSSANGSSVNANPNTTTVYNISGTSLLGCISSTTTTLAVIATPTISTIANPLTICAGQTSTLSAFGAANYSWSPTGNLTNINGSSTIATPLLTSTYNVIGSNGIAPFICVSTNTVQIVVIPNPTVMPSPQVIICEGQSTTIFATGGTTYSWSPTTGISNSHDSITFVSPVGSGSFIYTVTASTNNCSSTATVEILVNPLPIINAGSDTTINIDNSVVLFGTGDTQIGFLSPNGIPLSCNYCYSITVNPQNNTCYVLEGISALGCRSTDEVCITVTKDWDVFIPNAFTPDGDVINELFIPVGYGIDKIQLTIFDRWGHQVFKSNGDTIGWDGKKKGELCEQGVYIYQAEITAMSGVKLRKTGHLTLLSKVK
jgi:gliding motility-associated-like protein